jgi:hypothetical protein
MLVIGTLFTLDAISVTRAWWINTQCEHSMLWMEE